MKQIVFYSWQSDLPNPCNRGFIQEALDDAAESPSFKTVLGGFARRMTATSRAGSYPTTPVTSLHVPSPNLPVALDALL